MNKIIPRTEVGGVSLPRMLMGTNWLIGYSHRSDAADRGIREKYATPESYLPVVEAYLEYGVDAVMGPISTTPLALEAIKYAEEKTGRKMIIIDTPYINVDDTAEARAEALAVIKKSREIGSTFCLIHHASAEQLVNKNKRIIDRLPDYLYMIREEGLHPGLSAHMPELVQYSDLNEKRAADQIVKTDKRRASYHNFYADTRWGHSESYDLIIDSLKTGIDNTVELIARYAEMRFPGE